VRSKVKQLRAQWFTAAPTVSAAL
jgi:hypothetical protein